MLHVYIDKVIERRIAELTTLGTEVAVKGLVVVSDNLADDGQLGLMGL